MNQKVCFCRRKGSRKRSFLHVTYRAAIGTAALLPHRAAFPGSSCRTWRELHVKTGIKTNKPEMKPGQNVLKPGNNPVGTCGLSDLKLRDRNLKL